MATIRDIANRAKVSPGAVSRILNNDPTLSVTAQTRSNVISIAKEMGYVKPPRANTSSKALFSLGLVQWFSKEDERKDYYYLQARQGIEDFCVSNSISITSVFPGDLDAPTKLSSVDGIICLGKFSRQEIENFIQICPNVVFLDMTVKEYNITSLSMDFKGAVYDVLDYLVSLGHTHIGFLGGQEYVGNNELIVDPRATAFKAYMKKHKLEYKPYICEGSFSSQSGYEMMKQLIEKDSLPTAIFAPSDAIAIGAMKAITEAGLRIPQDISIVGFNNEDTCAFMNPPLTTVNAPSYDMGQHGANLVYVSSNLSIKTPLKAKIPCELVIRESCCEPKNKE